MITKLYSKKRMILIVGIILLLCGSYYLNQPKEESIVPLLEHQEVKVDTPKSICIDIKGAVKKPGVYHFEEGDRVQDAIQKSGGLLESADISTINLSRSLKDEMVIIIYTKDEIQAFLKEEQKIETVDQTCVCPKIGNDACIKEAITNQQSPNETPKGSKVSLNHGTIYDFQTLPGIGESKARAIVSYREEHGNFMAIEDIKKVSGIGDATFEKIKHNLTL